MIGVSATFHVGEYSRRRLISTRLDGGVVVWDIGSGRSVTEIEENFTWIGGLALSPDGRLLATGSEEPVVNICDLASGKRIDSLKGSRMCIAGVAFTSDSKTLATLTVDDAMKFWQIFTLGPLDPVHSFLFSPNGEYLAISWAPKIAGNSAWSCGARRPSRKSLPPKRQRRAKNEYDNE